MSFWSNLFRQKKDIVKATSPKVKQTQDWDYNQLKFDENGWLTYPNGLKLYNVNEEAFTDDVFEDVYSELNYLSGEVRSSFYNLNGEVVFSNESDILVIRDIFTNNIICIVTKDGKILRKQEIDIIKSKERKEWILYSAWGVAGLVTTLVSLGWGIKDRTIRKSFIEKVFKKECYSNFLDVDKYHFEFDEGFLTQCLYDGYDVSIFATDKALGIGLSEIDDYYEYANKRGRSDKTMKALINLQSYYLEKIDDDILMSDVSTKKFSYDEDGFCINFIAMAAFYNQSDVEEDVFLASVDGQYEILSKTTNNGITTTRIRAYREIFTFTNGHSAPEQIFASNQQGFDEVGQNETNTNEEGYVYVMVNPSLPDMVKIGMTTKDPNERAKELSSATGVPTPFILVFYKPFKDCYSIEQRIHRFLEDKGYRVKNNREFFTMPTNLAIDIVQAYYDIENQENKDN